MTTAANANAFPPAGSANAPRRAADAGTAFGAFKRLLKPIASLRLTVALLVMAILLVFAGTSAQKELGIWDVQYRYFYSWWCWIPFKYLFPLSGTAWAKLGGGFYFPGGYAIIVALLVNLLAAHTVRFKFNWKRSGILLIHFGLILLLVGELATSLFKHEYQLRFREGETRQWAHDVHHYEIALVEAGGAEGGKDRVTVVGHDQLSGGRTIRDAALPFDLHIDHWYPNAQPLGPMQPENDKAVRLATAGSLKDVGLLPMAKFTGVEAEQVDAPAAFVTLKPKDGGPPLGTYALSVYMGDQPQDVVVNGKTYGVVLRLARTYFPYTITLIDFAHDKYAGTEMARNFSSRIRLDDPAAGSPREVTIRMNEPLRYEGRTFFQSGFDPEDDKVTTLQVVDNPWDPLESTCRHASLSIL